MEIGTLYDLAVQQNIPVLPYPMEKTGSMSVMLEDGRCFIGMDASTRDGGTQERVHLGHELGHCLTGAALDCRQRHENRADKWAVEQLVPADDLDEAVAAGYTEIWQLAEFFGITEDLMRKAVCWYTFGNMAAELYF